MVEWFHAVSRQRNGYLATMAKRRKFKPEFKAQVVLESLAGVKSTAEICREHQIGARFLGRWRREFLEGHPKFSPPERGDVANRNGSPNWSGWSGAWRWSVDN